LVGGVVDDPIISLNHMTLGAGINLRILLARAGAWWKAEREASHSLWPVIHFHDECLSAEKGLKYAENGRTAPVGRKSNQPVDKKSSCSAMQDLKHDIIGTESIR
jgi:hypothetical protein